MGLRAFIDQRILEPIFRAACCEEAPNEPVIEKVVTNGPHGTSIVTSQIFNSCLLPLLTLCEDIVGAEDAVYSESILAHAIRIQNAANAEGGLQQHEDGRYTITRDLRTDLTTLAKFLTTSHDQRLAAYRNAAQNYLMILNPPANGVIDRSGIDWARRYN